MSTSSPIELAYGPATLTGRLAVILIKPTSKPDRDLDQLAAEANGRGAGEVASHCGRDRHCAGCGADRVSGTARGWPMTLNPRL